LKSTRFKVRFNSYSCQIQVVVEVDPSVWPQLLSYIQGIIGSLYNFSREFVADFTFLDLLLYVVIYRRPVDTWSNRLAVCCALVLPIMLYYNSAQEFDYT